MLVLRFTADWEPPSSWVLCTAGDVASPQRPARRRSQGKAVSDSLTELGNQVVPAIGNHPASRGHAGTTWFPSSASR